MCAIAGVYHRNGAPASPVGLKAMTDALAHRGPDGEGQVAYGPIGLGHRRLAIIDLSSLGLQPMVSRDGRYALTFNGEIYNYKELRAELSARGVRFASQTDTEVLLYAFEQWGVDAILKLNGMFAFAILDRHTQTLTLARDRFGVKPLYYAQAGDAFIFASEIKGILAYDGVRAAMDVEGLAEYLTFQNFFSDRTLFKDVRLLPQGTYLQVKAGAQPPTPVRYWDFRFEEPTGPVSEADAVSSSINCSAKRFRASWSATSTSAPICPAGWIQGRSPPRRRSSCRTCAPSR